MAQHSIRIQSVIYKNEKSTLIRAFESIANAFSVDKKHNGILNRLVVAYGDASPTPVFSNEEVREISERFRECFTFEYVFFGENTGTSKGHNRLSENCDCEYIMVMNPDVIVCPRYFETILLPFFEDDLNAGLVEARQVPIEHPKEYNPVTLETEWATGACFVMPANLFNEVHGFDADTFFLYCDDVDLSWRIRLTGKKLYYSPESIVYHAKTLRQDGAWNPTEAECYYSAEAAILMAYKWSNDELAEKLYNDYSNSDNPYFKKAAAKFKELSDNNSLPQKLDPDHKVARFVGPCYTEHRFGL